MGPSPQSSAVCSFPIQATQSLHRLFQQPLGWPLLPLLSPLIPHPGYTFYCSQSDPFKTEIRPYYSSVQNPPRGSLNLYNKTWHRFHGLQGFIKGLTSSFSSLRFPCSSHIGLLLFLKQAKGVRAKWPLPPYPQVFEWPVPLLASTGLCSNITSWEKTSSPILCKWPHPMLFLIPLLYFIFFIVLTTTSFMLYIYFLFNCPSPLLECKINEGGINEWKWSVVLTSEAQYLLSPILLLGSISV